jgi:hypothetical protein
MPLVFCESLAILIFIVLQEHVCSMIDEHDADLYVVVLGCDVQRRVVVSVPQVDTGPRCNQLPSTLYAVLDAGLNQGSATKLHVSHTSYQVFLVHIYDSNIEKDPERGVMIEVRTQVQKRPLFLLINYGLQLLLEIILHPFSEYGPERLMIVVLHTLDDPRPFRVNLLLKK